MENYFELFGISCSFNIENAALKKAFIQVQKKNHPDKFTHADNLVQENALHTSTIANKGFEVLSNFNKRLFHILLIKEVIDENEKFTLDSNFLMDMMEYNEAIEFIQDKDEKMKIKNELDLIQTKVLNELNYILIKPVEQVSKTEFNELKTYYYKQKYIQRLMDNL